MEGDNNKAYYFNRVKSSISMKMYMIDAHNDDFRNC